MSHTTTSATATAVPTNLGSAANATLFNNAIQTGKLQNVSIGTFMSSLITSLVLFTVQILVFLALRNSLPKI